MAGMFDRSKKFFFDRNAVLEATYGKTGDVMRRFGALTMTIARRSMRRVKNYKTKSKPGEPPRAHKGTLRDSITFEYSPEQRNVIIGPQPLPNLAVGIVPPNLEYGAVLKNTRRRVRRLGGGGEIRVGGRPCKTTKKNLDGKMVTYAKLTTAAQVARANTINEQLYGPATFTLQKRPYMAPAFAVAKAKLPAMWAAA